MKHTTRTYHAAPLRVTQGATRSSAGPSYGLPGQPETPSPRITQGGLDLLRPDGLVLLRR